MSALRERARSSRTPTSTSATALTQVAMYCSTLLSSAATDCATDSASARPPLLSRAHHLSNGFEPFSFFVAYLVAYSTAE